MSEFLYDKAVVCPACDNPFETKQVKSSHLKVLKRDDDFKIYYGGLNPDHYAIAVCPKCGYSAFLTDYKALTPAARSSFEKLIGSRWKRQDYCGERTWEQAVAAYKLAMLTYRATFAEPSTLAKLCVRIAWIYREVGRNEEEEYLTFARDQYLDAYTKEDFTGREDDELTAFFFLGELNLRLEDYKSSVEWFQRTLQHEKIQSKKMILEKTRDRRLLASDLYRDQKKVMG